MIVEFMAEGAGSQFRKTKHIYFSTWSTLKFLHFSPREYRSFLLEVNFGLDIENINPS